MLLRIILVLTLFLSGCSVLRKDAANRHLKKAERLMQKAIDKGAKVKRDTVVKTIAFTVPGIKDSRTVTFRSLRDTLFIPMESGIEAKVSVDTENKTATAEVKCPETIVERKIEVPCTEIKTGYSLYELIVLAVACLAVGYFSSFFIRIRR